MLMNLYTLDWDDELLKFFGVDRRCLAKIVSNSEVYGSMKGGALDGVPIAGMIGDQQGALVGNKCFEKGEAKNTYGT
jgi:glycerol kinase